MPTLPEDMNRNQLLRNLLSEVLRDAGGSVVLPAAAVEEDVVSEQFILQDGPGADYTLTLVVPGTTLIV